MAEVKFDEMRGKLLTLGQLESALAATEPIASYDISSGNTEFRLNDWNADRVSAEALEDTDLTSAVVRVSGNEFPLTKEALLRATSIIGLNQAYVTRTPSEFIEPALNYAFSESEKGLQLFSAAGRGVAFAKSSIKPFSNLALMDRVVRGLRSRIGQDEIFVDYKFNHSVAHTTARFIVPSISRAITGTGTEDDRWSVGIQFNNSLIGAKQTSLEGYMFRWWCTNGSIDIHSSTGAWNRKQSGQTADDVYTWAQESISGILETLERTGFDSIQNLVDIPVEGAAVDILEDIFNTYKIPAAERNAIVSNMVETTDLNMYSIMQAVTQVANSADLSPAHVERLMRAGGDIPHNADRCNECHRKI